MKLIEKKVYELILPYADDNNIEIFDVVYEKRGKDMFLTIYIEKKGGVSIDDCEKMSQYIDPLIDENIKIEEQYFLEVSSSGIEKVLRTDEHFKNNIGKEIKINLYKSYEDKKEYIGILKKFNDDEIVISNDDNEYHFNKKDISLIKTVFDWNNEGGNL